MDIKIEGFYTENTDYYQATLNLRSEIFIDEMGFEKRLEFDGKDDLTTHYILLYDLLPVGCARWMEKKESILIDRFGIDTNYRKRGLGILLIKFMLSELIPSKKTINIYCTDTSVVFFTQMGFKDSGKSEDFANKRVRILSFSNV